jgi:hypothetical protein
MTTIPQKLRYWIACYGAVITIALEHFAGPPTTSLTQTPVPLVRINEREVVESGWHPDELIDRGPRGLSVLVWDSSGPGQTSQVTGRLFLN